jgi:hypothetical protein
MSRSGDPKCRRRSVAETLPSNDKDGLAEIVGVLFLNTMMSPGDTSDDTPNASIPGFIHGRFWSKGGPILLLRTKVEVFFKETETDSTSDSCLVGKRLQFHSTDVPRSRRTCKRSPKTDGEKFYRSVPISGFRGTNLRWSRFSSANQRQ